VSSVRADFYSTGRQVVVRKRAIYVISFARARTRVHRFLPPLPVIDTERKYLHSTCAHSSVVLIFYALFYYRVRLISNKYLLNAPDANIYNSLRTSRDFAFKTRAVRETSLIITFSPPLPARRRLLLSLQSLSILTFISKLLSLESRRSRRRCATVVSARPFYLTAGRRT